MAAAAAETQLQEGGRVPTKRKLHHRERINSKEAQTKRSAVVERHKKVKRLRDRPKAMVRDSDAEEEDDGEDGEERAEASSSSEAEQGEGDSASGSEGEEEDGAHKGVTKFTHGCRAFKMAFTKIVKKSAAQADPLLGPVLSAHRKLVVKKLAEEVDEQKAKGEAKKQRQLASERGHVKPANFLDSKEKFLINVATKGVVRLFNAVNKAQNPQKGLDPSRSKDAKELAKQRKEAFFSEIRKSTTGMNDKHSSFNSNKFSASTGDDDGQPGWAPLRDSYMLTSSKLKDWDKMEG